MRLWHEALLPVLPNHQLLGQHRECCALRGKGWGRKHATVDYVFTHPYEWLVLYHYRVMLEMMFRGYSPSSDWFDLTYRGKNSNRYEPQRINLPIVLGSYKSTPPQCGSDRPKVEYIYPEHDDDYLQECLDNLKRKGIEITL